MIRFLDLWKMFFDRLHKSPQLCGLLKSTVGKAYRIERVDWLKSQVRFISHPSCEIP